jgi:2-oxoglutarate dehydrogenase complex dehydrogenase (E1) component-like enzyme
MPRASEAEYGQAIRGRLNVVRNVLGEQSSEAPAARWEAR